jgi:hypothetical protein
LASKPHRFTYKSNQTRKEAERERERLEEARLMMAAGIVTMDLLGGCGAAAVEDEVVDLEATVPAGWERRLDLLVSCGSLGLLCSVVF